ncbi:hypothetical protein ACFWMU_38855 [Streptomyces sp. NPDC058357]|uniref:hypothetical protein n=1 Tax=unclassified Streptomyces TaxID=2593676 RepID=UPI00364D2C3A
MTTEPRVRASARLTLASKVFHGRKDELCQCCYKGMEGRPGALGPVLECVTL